jgi:cytochrome c553
MPAEYITAQLMHFKSGVREPGDAGDVREPLAEDMKALGLYFAAQSPRSSERRTRRCSRPGSASTAGDAANGLPACAACHAPNGVGIPKNFPRLSGQYADYTYAQLKAFKAGERGNDPDGKDVDGRIMASVAQRMSDVQMKALADYTAGLR